MTNERVQRRIERLLDQIDTAEADENWERVRLLAQDVLSASPTDEEALSYLDAADRRLDDGQTTGARTKLAAQGTSPAEQPESPTSFAAGRYEVKRFLGEGAKKKV